MTIPSSQLRASAGQGGIVQGFHLLRSQDLFRNGSYGMQSAFPPSIMIPSTVLNQHKYLSFLCKRMAHPITRLQKMAYWIVLFENQMIRKIIFFVDKSYHPLWRFTIEMWPCVHFSEVNPARKGEQGGHKMSISSCLALTRIWSWHTAAERGWFNKHKEGQVVWCVYICMCKEQQDTGSWRNLEGNGS